MALPHIIILAHARRRALQKGISIDGIIRTVNLDDVIESWNDGIVWHRLLLGHDGNRPIHVATERIAGNGVVIVVTAYHPSPRDVESRTEKTQEITMKRAASPSLTYSERNVRLKDGDILVTIRNAPVWMYKGEAAYDAELLAAVEALAKRVAALRARGRTQSQRTPKPRRKTA